MTGAVLGLTLRLRARTTLLSALGLAIFLPLAIAAYSTIDMSIYDQMPEALRSIMGIPAGADASALAYNVVYGSMGAVVMAGLAVSAGAAAIAGEEGDRTLGLLLSTPISRTRVLLSKAGAVGLLLLAAAGVLWLGGIIAPILLDAATGETHVGAAVVHLTAGAALHGSIALAIGAWTGRRRLAGTGTAVFVAVSFVLRGLLPLRPATEGLTTFIPWQHIDGNAPLVNGVNPGDLAFMLIGTVALLVLAIVGLGRRDLHQDDTSLTLLDRLRGVPLTHALAERLAGRVRVSGLFSRAVSEPRGLVIGASGLMVALGLLEGVLYESVASVAGAMLAQIPEEMLAFVGGSGLTSAAGWIRIEVLGLVAPAAVIGVGVTIAMREIAGQERDGTLRLLLSTTVPRRRVVAVAGATAGLGSATVAVATGIGIAAASLIGGLDLDLGGVLAATIMLVLLGWVFTALALALSAGTGRARLTIGVTVTTAVALYLADGVLRLSDALSSWSWITPFHHYALDEPLVNGLPVASAVALLVAAGMIAATAAPLMERRDLRG